MLARLGALLETSVRPVLSPTLDAMKELHSARQALVKDRTAALNRQKMLRANLLKRQNARRLGQIEAQLTAIDVELTSVCAADTDLERRRTILTSIPGVGATTALLLLVEMPEFGRLEPGPAASLAGLAPTARDLGHSKGKRFIRGGLAA